MLSSVNLDKLYIFIATDKPLYFPLNTTQTSASYI